MADVDRLVACLASLAKLHEAPSHEVVVVGNGTPVETLAALAGLDSLVVVPSPVNLGFAGGCNWGARFARGRHLVFLNDDTEVEAGWLRALVEVAESEPRAGAVGSRLLSPDGSLQEAGSILWRDAGTHQVGHGLPAGSDSYNRVRQTDYCSGCGLLVTRDAWGAVGGFDERYFPAYFEDVDLCLSLRARGFRTLYAPNARLVHHGGASLPDDLRALVAVRSGRRFLAKWATPCGTSIRRRPTETATRRWPPRSSVPSAARCRRSSPRPRTRGHPRRPPRSRRCGSRSAHSRPPSRSVTSCCTSCAASTPGWRACAPSPVACRGDAELPRGWLDASGCGERSPASRRGPLGAGQDAPRA